MKRQAHSAAPLGWGRYIRPRPGERGRLVRCAKCHAVADCETYERMGREMIGRSGLLPMPRGKHLVHRGCGGRLALFDIGGPDAG